MCGKTRLGADWLRNTYVVKLYGLHSFSLYVTVHAYAHLLQYGEALVMPVFSGVRCWPPSPRNHLEVPSRLAEHAWWFCCRGTWMLLSYGAPALPATQAKVWMTGRALTIIMT